MNVVDRLHDAARAAKRGQKRDFRLAAIALRKDGVLVVSCNGNPHFSGYPNEKKICHSSHAEYRALQKAGKGATLWVARVNSSGQWAMAKPCPKCQSLIKSMAVKKVYYTIGPNEWGTWVPQGPIEHHEKVFDELNNQIRWK